MKNVNEYILHLEVGQVKVIRADDISEAIQKSGIAEQRVISYSKYVNGKKIISKEPITDRTVNPTIFSRGMDDIIDEYKRRQGKLVVITSDIPLFHGRPERDTIITEDEIMNVSIALNSAKSLKELLTII